MRANKPNASKPVQPWLRANPVGARLRANKPNASKSVQPWLRANPVGARLRANLPERIKMFAPKGAPATAEPRDCVPSGVMEWLRARGVRSQASSYRGQWNGSVPAVFARKRAPTGVMEWFRARGVRVVGVRLRTNLLRSFLCPPCSQPNHGIAFCAPRVRSQASSYRGQWNGFVFAVFARKRAPTGADES